MRALAIAAVLAGLAGVLPGHAQAAAPVPWCGTPTSVDRVPDATPGFSIHVVYARPPGAPDRFAEWAPRIAGDAAEMEAWWRSQDPTRSPRFDLFAAPGCANSFGALDITSVQVTIREARTGLQDVATQLVARGFSEREKTYLVYFDGPTAQEGRFRICGIGTPPSRFGPGFALVYLEPCGAETDDAVRVSTAAHELVHALDAVLPEAPGHCPDDEDEGHVCDGELDLMAPIVSGEPLSAHVLDVDRDDYYGHGGAWTDVRKSRFLEQLDSPDRSPPTVPAALRVGDAPGGVTRFSWRAAQDDVGPVSYRVHADGELLVETTATSLVVETRQAVTRYSVRAADGVGHLSPAASVRFRAGAGLVDESGRLVRDTVRPPAITRVVIRQTRSTSTLTWAAVRDPGGLRSYRIRIGSRTLNVRKPAITLARARVTGSVSIAAVDRAGNVGPAIVVPRTRVR